MRKILCAVSIFALALIFAMPAFAAVEVRVIDNMAKIGDSGLRELNAYAKEISGKYQIDVAFFLPTNDYAPGQTLDEYTREYWSGIENGFVLAYDIDGKAWTLANFGEAMDYISSEIQDQLWAAFADTGETYFDGILAYLQEVDALLAEPGDSPAEGETLPAPVTSILERDPASFKLLVDEAGLLTDAAEAAALQEKLTALSAKWKNDIVIVTVDSIGTAKPVEFADDWFDYGGYGQGENFDGLLLLLNMDERDWWISTKGYGITAFTDAGIEFLGKQLVSDGLSDGEYGKAFDSFADWCDKFFARAETGKPFDNGSLPKTSADVGMLVIFAFGGGLVVAWLVTKSMKNKLKTVRKKQAAADYVRPGSLQVAYANEQFLFKNVTRTKIETSSSGGGGGSSTHTSSSGSSHGGGGGKF